MFMVGDEHQSIYRFRNADLEVFRAERRAAPNAPDRDVLPLRGNFRSRPAVLAAVNALGRALLGGFTELTAGREAGDGPGSVELLLTLDEGTRPRRPPWDAEGDRPRAARPSASPAKVIAEARFLAQRLRELVDDERGRARARSSSCCGPSPMSTPTRRRSPAPACGPSSSAAAAIGPSSRSRT